MKIEGVGWEGCVGCGVWEERIRVGLNGWEGGKEVLTVRIRSWRGWRGWRGWVRGRDEREKRERAREGRGRAGAVRGREDGSGRDVGGGGWVGGRGRGGGGRVGEVE
jgi:hypothetical protein